MNTWTWNQDIWLVDDNGMMKLNLLKLSKRQFVLPAGKLFRACLPDGLTEHEIKSAKDVALGSPTRVSGHHLEFVVDGARILVSIDDLSEEV